MTSSSPRLKIIQALENSVLEEIKKYIPFYSSTILFDKQCLSSESFYYALTSNTHSTVPFSVSNRLKLRNGKHLKS